MPKPSEIFDTPEATGFSRVVGNEDWEDDFRKQFDELKLKPPKNSMKNAERELIIWYFRNLLTTKDQEKEEAVKRERSRILKEIDDSRDHDSCECDNCHRWCKYYKKALPTEDNN